MKSLIEKESEIPVPTFEKVFKFDISLENIERMLAHIIDMEKEDA